MLFIHFFNKPSHFILKLRMKFINFCFILIMYFSILLNHRNRLPIHGIYLLYLLFLSWLGRSLFFSVIVLWSTSCSCSRGRTHLHFSCRWLVTCFLCLRFFYFYLPISCLRICFRINGRFCLYFLGRWLRVCFPCLRPIYFHFPVFFSRNRSTCFCRKPDFCPI